MRRLAIALLLSGVAVVTTAPPAFAHAELTASSPAENASIASAPTRIELTFNEAVTLPADALEVVGPDNVTWQVGTPQIAGAKLTFPVTPNGPAGRYTIVYRVVSGDGDPVSGSVAFTLTSPAVATTTATTTTTTTTTTTVPAPASTEPSQTSPAAGDGGTLLWVWLAAGAVLLAALVFVTLRVRRPGR